LQSKYLYILLLLTSSCAKNVENNTNKEYIITCADNPTQSLNNNLKRSVVLSQNDKGIQSYEDAFIGSGYIYVFGKGNFSFNNPNSVIFEIPTAAGTPSNFSGLKNSLIKKLDLNGSLITEANPTFDIISITHSLTHNLVVLLSTNNKIYIYNENLQQISSFNLNLPDSTILHKVVIKSESTNELQIMCYGEKIYSITYNVIDKSFQNTLEINYQNFTKNYNWNVGSINKMIFSKNNNNILYALASGQVITINLNNNTINWIYPTSPTGWISNWNLDGDLKLLDMIESNGNLILVGYTYDYSIRDEIKIPEHIIQSPTYPIVKSLNILTKSFNWTFINKNKSNFGGFYSSIILENNTLYLSGSTAYCYSYNNNSNGVIRNYTTFSNAIITKLDIMDRNVNSTFTFCDKPENHLNKLLKQNNSIYCLGYTGIKNPEKNIFNSLIFRIDNL